MQTGSRKTRLRRRPAAAEASAAAAVDRCLEHGFPRLYFPGPLEQRFEAETGAARRRHLVRSCLLAMLVYNLFLAIDFLVLPDVFTRALVVRVGVMSPFGLLVMWLLHRGLAPRWREGIMVLLTVAVSCSVVYLAAASADPRAVFHANGTFLIIAFANIVVRLRFWYAVTATLLSVAILFLGGELPHALGDVSWRTNVLVLFATGVFTLFANYTQEREHRQNYLLGLRDTFRRAELAADNTRLTQLTHTDSLTGILNRRAIDDYLQRLFDTPRDHGVSLIMLDIDQFKKYNDCYGHPAGDECIRRVAAVLRAALRRTEDRVGRYGGEEFVVVLAEADPANALKAAERMRAVVEGLAIPHCESAVAPCITISAGVATATALVTPAALLAAADTALYEAKANGRNRVALAVAPAALTA